MQLESIEKIVKGAPKFRLKQINKAVFCDLISDWKEATNLPKELRQKLGGECPLDIKAEKFSSKNGLTEKARLYFSDGSIVESVLMRHSDKRNTVCVSCQAGCPLGCLFCSTGQLGFKRNLNHHEIIEQVVFFARELKKKNQRVNNVVFMGMGEPFLNWPSVRKAIETLNSREGFNIGSRKISVSTAGIPEGIKNISRECPQINLAISLHAPNNELRSRLMPINKKYPLAEVLQTVDEYIEITNRKVMFEYVMLRDINDSAKQAEELAKIMKKPLYMVNLIAYNSNGKFESSSTEKINKFKKILEEAGVFVTQRYSFGSDIEAACGQLANKKIKDA